MNPNTPLPTLDPQRRRIICREIAGEIVETIKIVRLAQQHGWTGTAFAMRRQTHNLRAAWHYYHRPI